jgi:hypothetical protein
MISSRALDPATSGRRQARRSPEQACRDRDGTAVRAEILSRPFENTCEIELCRPAEPDTPFPLDHDALLSCARNDFLGKFIQISLQLLDIFEFFEFAPIQCGGADACCFP